jgi:YidC/Oxa1 family membrane protein insertase
VEKRALIAAVLMAALLVIYQMYFFPATHEPTPKPPAPTAAPTPAPTAPAAPAPAPAPAAAVPKTAAAPRVPEAPRPPQRLVPVEAPLYRAVVSSEGGKFQEFVLKFRGEKPMVIVGDLGPTGLIVAPDPRQPGQPVPMAVSAGEVGVGPAHPAERLQLSGEIDGLKVREALGFRADAYSIEIDVRVENAGSAPRTIAVALPWQTRQKWPPSSEKFTGQHPVEIVWSEGGHVQRIDDLTTVGERGFEGEWIALESVFYLAALMPRTPGFKLVATSEGKPPEVKNGSTAPAGRAGVAVRATPTIAPGQAWEGRVLVYAGPKEYERLRALGLQDTINFGGFPVPRKWGGLPMEWFGVPILLLMNWVYKYVGNYGIAIILLTVVSKVLFYPLTVKSMRSMKAMQALQPQINALRSKYKNDPQRVQRETLELYKKYKVNPMGGCLPMIAQVPIFYALYLALSVSVDLQNASFLCFGRFFGADLWICDLAAHDPTYVLPVFMGITMFVQQKMTPTAGDPRQQKMMLLIMPAFFTMMFVNLASGLVLYWTVSNILQILQQWYMDRSARAAREAKDA